MRAGASIAALAAALAAVVLLAAPAHAQEADGETLYQANCSQCHQAGGGGVPGLFPPLAGNDNVQDAEYVRSVIRNGREGQIEVLGQTYDGQMPAIGGLNDAEVDAIIQYVQIDLQAAAEPSTGTTEAPDAGEDVEGIALLDAAARGRRLFAGWEELANGGPACLACHTAGDLGNLSGPGLGGDLTGLFASLGSGSAVRVALADPHPGDMAALYADDPLTDAERSDLAAFFETEGAERDTFVDGLVVIALGGVLLAVGFAVAIGFGRREEDEA